MEKRVLVALKNSASSSKVVEFLASMPLCSKDFSITLLNVYRKPSASEELMGEEFFKDEPARLRAFMENARQKLVQGGYHKDRIEIELVSDPYPTIAEGIIDRFEINRGTDTLVGRNDGIGRLQQGIYHIKRQAVDRLLLFGVAAADNQ